MSVDLTHAVMVNGSNTHRFGTFSLYSNRSVCPSLIYQSSLPISSYNNCIDSEVLELIRIKLLLLCSGCSELQDSCFMAHLFLVCASALDEIADLELLFDF